MNETMKTAGTLAYTFETTLRRALGELLMCEACEFLTIKPLKSEQYVQFVGSAESPLVLDLPAVDLTPAERARAHVFIESTGGQIRKWYDDPFEDEDAPTFSFVLDLDRDIDQAIDVVREVFEFIYDHTDEQWMHVETIRTPFRQDNLRFPECRGK